MPRHPGYLSLVGRATTLEGQLARRQGDFKLAARRRSDGAAHLLKALRLDPDRYFDRLRPSKNSAMSHAPPATISAGKDVAP